MHGSDLVELWTQRIVTEFTECPGLRLTAAQAARFWGIDTPTVERILEGLVRRAVLARNADGTLTRATEPRRRV